MNAICLPVPLVLLLRRLFNAFSAFSISQNYLSSRWKASLEPPDGAIDLEQNVPERTHAVGRPRSSWNMLKGFGVIQWYTSKMLPPIEGGGILAKHMDASPIIQCSKNESKASRASLEPQSPIYRLISSPTLFDPVRAPRYPIVLCHGLYGFDVRGPETFPKLRMHYWSNVLHVLRNKVGAEVVVTGVPGTGSIASRAERMDRFLRERVKGREINFLAHSMGGLDCRHLITHIQPEGYTPLSLTSLSVPHRGSPFMDWCLANIGIGSPRPFPFPSSASNEASPSSSSSTSSSSHLSHHTLPYTLKSPIFSRVPPPPQGASSPSSTLSMLPSSFTSMILSLIDSPAYANLTTSFLRDKFNPQTPDKSGIKYFSVAARTGRMSVWHPLWLPKLIIDAAEEQEAFAVQQGSQPQPRYPHGSDAVAVSYPDMDLRQDRDPERGNDGLVTVSSAKWGEHLGTMEMCDHWELRGARGLGAEWDEGWGKAWREWVGSWRAGEDGAAGAAAGKRKEKNGKVKDWATQNDLTNRFDLERFYVALSRKLYDEGL